MSPGHTRQPKEETYEVLEDIRRIIDQSAGWFRLFESSLLLRQS
jgi:hypothetical protein